MGIDTEKKFDEQINLKVFIKTQQYIDEAIHKLINSMQTAASEASPQF